MEPKFVDFDQLPDVALVRQSQILPLLPFSSPTLWRRVKDRQFPQPRKVGGCTCWQWGEVRAWLAGEWHPRSEEAVA